MHLRPGGRPLRAVGLLAFALVGAMCGSALGAATSTTIPVTAGPLHLRTDLNPHGDTLAFFPRVVTVHAGDRVRWAINGFHTVTFAGSLHPYPFVATTTAKQPAKNDAAGTPFWWAGTAPQTVISPLAILQQGGGVITSGGQVRSSGLQRVLQATATNPPAPYVLRFAKPGVYRYQCAVHPSMHGVIRVLPRSADVPSPAYLAQLAEAQFARVIRQVKGLSRRAPAVTNRVWVGVGTRQGAEVTAMFPPRLSVSRGTTVTFANNDPTDIHTLTFGPAALRSRIEQTFIAPQGTPPVLVFNPLGLLPSEPPGSPVPVAYDGANHGNGYLNAGLLSPRGAPGPGGSAFRITFSKPGVYHYECVIHHGMDGTVVVT